MRQIRVHRYDVCALCRGKSAQQSTAKTTFDLFYHPGPNERSRLAGLKISFVGNDQNLIVNTKTANYLLELRQQDSQVRPFLQSRYDYR